MNREKFDLELQDKVRKFEQEHIPVFNERKVWGNTNRANGMKKWYAAASVVIILGLSVVFQQYNRPVVISKLRKPLISHPNLLPVPYMQPDYPSVEGAAKPAIASIDTPREKIPVPVQVSIIHPDTPSAPLLIDAKPVVNAVLVTEVQTLPTGKAEIPDEEIKVMFKRGSSERSSPTVETRLTFKKFKLRTFDDQTNDTSAYASGAEVEAERKFRIKF